MHKLLAGAVLTLGVISGQLQAGVINLDSLPGLPNSLTPATVAISVHPSWEPNNPVNPGNPADTSAVWISYDYTGYKDPVFQPYEGTTPVVSIFENFVSGPGFLTLNVWADDTSEVLLDGVSLIAPKFTQSTCSGQPIGCLPQDVGSLSSVLTAGPHQLEFRVFQVGTGLDTTTNPMGLMFTGTAPAAVPEPGTLLLLGGASVTAALKRKRLARRQ
jgi:hypothetical protein